MYNKLTIFIFSKRAVKKNQSSIFDHIRDNANFQYSYNSRKTLVALDIWASRAPAKEDTKKNSFAQKFRVFRLHYAGPLIRR